MKLVSIVCMSLCCIQHSDVNSTLKSYFTKSIIVMLENHLVRVKVNSVLSRTVTQLWQRGCKGQRAPTEQRRVESADWCYCMCNVWMFPCSKNVLLKNQNIGEFPLYQPLVLTQITVSFLCYLLLNNYRNRGNVCRVYEWKVKTMSM